jgi:hypothetical protein
MHGQLAPAVKSTILLHAAGVVSPGAYITPRAVTRHRNRGDGAFSAPCA